MTSAKSALLMAAGRGSAYDVQSRVGGALEECKKAIAVHLHLYEAWARL